MKKNKPQNKAKTTNEHPLKKFFNKELVLIVIGLLLSGIGLCFTQYVGAIEEAEQLSATFKQESEKSNDYQESINRLLETSLLVDQNAAKRNKGELFIFSQLATNKSNFPDSTLRHFSAGLSTLKLQLSEDVAGIKPFEGENNVFDNFDFYKNCIEQLECEKTVIQALEDYIVFKQKNSGERDEKIFKTCEDKLMAHHEKMITLSAKFNDASTTTIINKHKNRELDKIKASEKQLDTISFKRKASLSGGIGLILLLAGVLYYAFRFNTFGKK